MKCSTGLLKYVWTESYFDVPPSDHDPIHLFECQLSRFRQVVLDEREPLVLHGDGIPGHVDALDGSEGVEGLPDGVLLQLEADGADVDPAHEGYGSLPLGLHLQVGHLLQDDCMKGRTKQKGI